MAAHNLDEQAVFDVARKLACREAREAHVQQACGDNAAIGLRVRALLHAYEESVSFLEAPVAPLLAATLDEPIRERPGTAIGPFKLLEQIGEGGMGLVFMAEQTQPVRRRVALKVLKPGMDSRQIVARFEAERQALALMDHPHIAQVFDGGATATGRPYFVMELVRGVPITEFCHQGRLTTRQRLELFALVCQAVQHAHHKGIIHRDLKPSNVLVTLHDTVAVPKVIDFGIAKATTGPLTERTLFTHFAQLIGTPLYMSPEQAEMNGLDVDTRSDVYSLGVLLYELLTGTTPFESETLKKVGIDEMRRIIREDEPPRPSQRIDTLSADTCSTASERRGVDARRLGQVLRGELDWIVMKALEKDRNRRYESASAMAADVQRYLNDEAVAACPPSAGYRVRKFARRNRRPLVMAGVVVVALLATTVLSTWQAVEANMARRLADERLENEKKARNDAANEAAIARAVNAFLQVDLLGQAASAPGLDQVYGSQPLLTVREALDRASARIGQRFQDRPLVEAAIQTTIGTAYSSLREYQLAVPHLEQAVALRKAHLASGHPNTFASMGYLADADIWVGRHSEAIALRRQILEHQKALLGPDHPDTLNAIGQLAVSYRQAGRWDVSVRLLEQVLEKQCAIRGSTHPDTLSTMHKLAMNYGDVDRLEESLALHEKYLELSKSEKVHEDRRLWSMMTFAQVCQRAGRLDRADQLLRKVLDHNGKRKGSLGQKEQRANGLGWLALNLLLQEQYGNAEAAVREAIEINQLDKFRRSYWMTLLGEVLCRQQNYAEAEPFLVRGNEHMNERPGIIRASEKRLLAEARGRLVHFYEMTMQPEKAQVWREKRRAETNKQ